MTSENSDDEVQVGRAPTHEESLYSRIHDDMVVGTLPFLNQVLRQFVTLNSAFIGVAIAVYDKPIIHKECSLIGMIFLFIGMVFAVIGMMPSVRNTPLGYVDARKKMIDEGTRWKLNLAYLSCTSFGIAVLVITIGIALNLLA